jgi:hypothetical protein
MMKAILWVAVLLSLALPLPAQDLVGMDDFLSDHEADLIRSAQDPNERILQYLQFAQLRIELVKQRLASSKPGRSPELHKNLKQYGQIMETIDEVIDDALSRKLDTSKGIEALVQQGELFAADLHKIADNPAKDQWAYEFVLKDAIDITEDTIEASQGDLAERARAVQEADAKHEEKRLESMTPTLKEEVTKTKKEEQKKAAEQERKRPTLRKPGEQTEKKP